MSPEEHDALAWLTSIAEGDREGLVINAKSASRAAVIRRLLARAVMPHLPPALAALGP